MWSEPEHSEYIDILVDILNIGCESLRMNILYYFLLPNTGWLLV